VKDLGLRVTEVRVKLAQPWDSPRVKAYARVILNDALVIDRFRVVEINSRLIVIFPSAPAREACHVCGHKAAITACYCPDCGAQLYPGDRVRNRHARAYEYAFPISREAREVISAPIMSAYLKALQSNVSALEVVA
jgi:DNA-binding cell septation regulator SpoVG